MGRTTLEREKLAHVDTDAIRDISERVYIARMGIKDAGDMIAADKDNGEGLRRRAACYDTLTLAYLEALNIPLPRLETEK